MNTAYFNRQVRQFTSALEGYSAAGLGLLRENPSFTFAEVFSRHSFSKLGGDPTSNFSLASILQSSAAGQPFSTGLFLGALLWGTHNKLNADQQQMGFTVAQRDKLGASDDMQDLLHTKSLDTRLLRLLWKSLDKEQRNAIKNNKEEVISLLKNDPSVTIFISKWADAFNAVMASSNAIDNPNSENLALLLAWSMAALGSQILQNLDEAVFQKDVLGYGGEDFKAVINDKKQTIFRCLDEIKKNPSVAYTGANAGFVTFAFLQSGISAQDLLLNPNLPDVLQTGSYALSMGLTASIVTVAIKNGLEQKNNAMASNLTAVNAAVGAGIAGFSEEYLLLVSQLMFCYGHSRMGAHIRKAEHKQQQPFEPS